MTNVFLKAEYKLLKVRISEANLYYSKAETMIVAMDIEKDKNWAIFRAPSGQDSKPFVFTTTREGFDNPLIDCAGIKRITTPATLLSDSSRQVFMPTHWYTICKPRGIRLVLVNPVHTKRVKEIRDNSPNKTDKKDPGVIADIIQLGCVLNVIAPKGEAAELCQLNSRTRTRYWRQKRSFEPAARICL